MKSLKNIYEEVHDRYKIDSFAKLIDKFETDHFKMKNEYSDLIEDFDQLKFELESIKKDDSNNLVNISKKLNKILKKSGEKEMVEQVLLQRAKILDHFTLAYLAETGLKPSEIKLVQGYDENGFFEMHFEKNTQIIMPEDIKL